MTTTVFIVCIFTFIMSLTDTLAYCMRVSGIRTGQIAIAMSFVTSTLLISRLSNMFQAPLLGALVDTTIMSDNLNKLEFLEMQFRWIIFFGFLAVLVGMVLSPTMINIFESAIKNFRHHGSMIQLIGKAIKPTNILKWIRFIERPKFSNLSLISLIGIPKTFLVLNIFVTAIHGIGVLCSLLAGAYLPEYRATALMLSGIVNGLATIMLTLFVDPSGARITDQAMHDVRTQQDVRNVVFLLQMGRALGLLVVAQVTLLLFTRYIMVVTQWIAGWAM